MMQNKKTAQALLYLIAFIGIFPVFIYFVEKMNGNLLEINNILQHPAAPMVYLLLSLAGVFLCFRYALRAELLLLIPGACMAILPILSERHLVEIPSGAVMSFNLEGGCPKGWYPLKESAGRTIIGVGQGEGLSEKQWLEMGGSETHQLTVAEMPGHNHISGIYNRLVVANKRQTTAAGKYLDNKDGGQLSEPNLQRSGVMRSAGGSKAHNNMPPYLALHICQKGG
jgi:microcystin-dependent protein